MQAKFILVAPALLSLAATSNAQSDQALNRKLIDLEAKVELLFAELDAAKSGDQSESNFSFGGYGEYHGNFGRNGGAKFADPHRFVFYMGYDFGAGIQLHSETEIEHGFVKDGNGEISIEQLYVDIEAGESSVISIGRMLNPLGIINHRHEPTTFNGVERPNLEKYIIPSTWSQDGFGFRGPISENISYQLQYTSSLDSSKFDSKDGIRSGRSKERPGLGDMALSGRFDWTPASTDGLRIGASFFSGGATSGNKGATVAGDATVDIFAIDFDYAVGDFDLRGVFAESHIGDVENLNSTFANDVGAQQAGSYIELAYHVFDRGVRDADARFPDSDLVVFARLEEYDTQDELAPGSSVDTEAGREENTFGIGWWLTPQFVIKADYQALDYSTDGITREDQLNFGIAWTL